MYCRADCAHMQGCIHPQHMEWLMQQRMQVVPPAVAPRAYHLEPIAALPKRGSSQGVMTGQNPGGCVMGGMSAYGPGPMVGEAQEGRPSSFPAGFTGGAAYVPPSVRGTHLTGYGASGCVSGPAAMPYSQNTHPALFAEGCAASNSDWNSINFNGIFNSALDPQIQLAVGAQDDGKPLPFPPGNLLAQYPTDYQQQLIFYYRLLRLQYPDLYQQYVDYYETYYKPLYHPEPLQPKKNNARPKQPKMKSLPLQPPPIQKTEPQHYIRERPQPVIQPAPPVEQPKTPNSIPRTASNLSGGLKRQSSLRRQNSMRRNEVNQTKNEGGLKRLPSMRQQ
ncbi:hypothetical protein LSCM1_02811 [Leishmania martiniquensis]|uniref:Uncharacterized protein n=1 Tax=Leishmania martiniquensis TaxID=1580590 RepID=A0A836H372_9TRYP|nr:hypothetical protein LSCM1_02811 [Leishmania martiniquensis]